MLRPEKVQRPGHPIWIQWKEPDLLPGTRQIEEDGSMYFALVELIETEIKDRMDETMNGGRIWYDFRFHLEVRNDQEEPTVLRETLYFDEIEFPWKATRQKSWRKEGKVFSEWLVEEDPEWR